MIMWVRNTSPYCELEGKRNGEHEESLVDI